MIAPAVYIIGFLTMATCAALLFKGYHNGRKKLLLWSGLCFCGLALSNLLVFVDLVLLPQIDLYRYRLTAAIIAMAFLLYGLIWESKS